jgi:hypothetical protein
MNLVPLNQFNYTNNTNKNHIIHSNNININSRNIDTETERLFSSQSRLNQLFHIPSLAKKCFFLFFLLIIFTLGILVVVITMKIKQTNSLKNQLEIKENIILETTNQSNQATKQLNNRLSENIKTIEELKNQQSESEKEKSRIYPEFPINI